MKIQSMNRHGNLETTIHIFSTSFNHFDGHALGSSDINKPIDSLFKFMIRDMIELMIDETNIYVKQRYAQTGKSIAEWKEVDESQLLAFLGLLFIIGFHRLPSIRDYWSQDRNFGCPDIRTSLKITCEFTGDFQTGPSFR